MILVCSGLLTRFYFIIYIVVSILSRHAIASCDMVSFRSFDLPCLLMVESILFALARHSSIHILLSLNIGSLFVEMNSFSIPLSRLLRLVFSVIMTMKLS